MDYKGLIEDLVESDVVVEIEISDVIGAKSEIEKIVM